MSGSRKNGMAVVAGMNMQAAVGCFLRIRDGCGSLAVGVKRVVGGNGFLAVGEEGGGIDFFYCITNLNLSRYMCIGIFLFNMQWLFNRNL
jgi:hypothetical protein